MYVYIFIYKYNIKVFNNHFIESLYLMMINKIYPIPLFINNSILFRCHEAIR